MKKTILSVLSVLGVGYLTAQTIVSTSVEKRAPVLEEFTGVNCQYCPDGHKRAQQYKTLNPKAVLMNIHSGPYANTTPDYRTPYGQAIDDQANPSGYPAGSISRTKNMSGVTYMTPGYSAMSRGDWNNAFALISSQNSPVNIAIEPTFNESNNQLSILVEVYYTDSTDLEDYLTVALLQSNIKGPQVSGAVWYPEMVYPDGEYNHNHMLRHMLTGQWGIEIPTTGENFFWDTTIVYTLPSSLYGIPTVWSDMEVAAFVADDEDNIYTGTSEWFVLEENLWDLKATTTYDEPSNYCVESVDFKIDVKNNGAQTITAFDINFDVNGGTTQTQSYSGSLAPGQSTPFTVTVNLESGSNVVGFYKISNVKDNNGNDLYNPEASGFLNKPSGATMISAQSDLEPEIEDDFEDYDAGSWPSTFFVTETDGSYPIVANEDYLSFATNAIGGFGESDNSLYFPLGYSTITAGTAFSVTTDNYDFSNASDAKLKFSYAYGSLESSDESEITIDVSTDCGETWENVKEYVGEEINTSGVDADYIILPEEDEWEKESVSLKDYVGQSSVMVRIRIEKDQCNTFLIDDIATTTTPVGVNDVVSSELSVYPNPANDVLNISGLEGTASVKIYDYQGRLVVSEASTHGTLNVSKLSQGVYTLAIENNNTTSNVKLNIVR